MQGENTLKAQLGNHQNGLFPGSCRIMRHSDIKLMTKTYTDAGLLPLAETVINLPSLTK
jgi:hypothetical protein